MTDLVIRPYATADLEGVRAIFNRVVADGNAFVYDAPLSPAEMSAYVASFTAAYVAERDGRVVGAYLLRPNFPGRGGHVANAAYIVSPDARGGGIGRRLGEHSLATARDMGFAAVQFNAVVSTNTDAVRLWTRLGFAVVGTVPAGFRLPDGRFADLLIMHRAV